VDNKGFPVDNLSRERERHAAECGEKIVPESRCGKPLFSPQASTDPHTSVDNSEEIGKYGVHRVFHSIHRADEYDDILNLTFILTHASTAWRNPENSQRDGK
jgi:hypothetical protein